MLSLHIILRQNFQYSHSYFHNLFMLLYLSVTHPFLLLNCFLLSDLSKLIYRFTHGLIFQFFPGFFLFFFGPIMNSFGLMELYQFIGVSKTSLSTHTLLFLLSCGKHCQVAFVNSKFLLLFCECMVGVYCPRTLWNLYSSPTFVWILGMKLRSPSHLVCPQIAYFKYQTLELKFLKIYSLICFIFKFYIGCIAL